VLQSFERRLGGLVEGAFAKVFKGDVQPAEIAQALARETDNNRNVMGHDKVTVPNEFVVELGDHDHERLAEWAEPLGNELATMVREHAAERGYSFVGPVAVGFAHVEDLDTGRFRVRSLVQSAAGGGDAAQVVDSGPPMPAATPIPGRPRLVLSPKGTATSGSPESRSESRSFVLEQAVTTLGRARDCDLTIDDPGISRRHAEVRVTHDDTEIIDLGSTNGVRVNGALLARAVLHDGDRIDLGSTVLTFRFDER
jgi:hypothetical protein